MRWRGTQSPSDLGEPGDTIDHDREPLALGGGTERRARTTFSCQFPVLGPLLDSPDGPPAPVELRRALATIDRSIDTYITDARLGTAA